jgi:uncharacterized membrane protein YraQ (UPF0718 family)
VIELGIILALLLGWQFTLAEFIGGPVMIVLVALMFRVFVRSKLLDDAAEQAAKGLAGSMECHASMDMSVAGPGTLARRLFSADGFTAVSHVFVTEWAAVLRDIVVGLLIAGAVAAWVPDAWWQTLFFAHSGLGSALWGPLIGPVVAILSFVCSIGNVPLAVVLWNGGISFGGVTSFIFADLLILPILNIYRKYYGMKMTLRILAIFYAAMVAAGYAVEAIFAVTGMTPVARHGLVMAPGISWNYTSQLNVVFLALAALLVWRFIATGGAEMLSEMGGAPRD